MDAILTGIDVLIKNDYAEYEQDLLVIKRELETLKERLDTTKQFQQLQVTPITDQKQEFYTPEPKTPEAQKRRPRSSDIPSLPNFKTPLPKHDESFATGSSHSMPRIPYFRTPAAKYTPSTAMSSPNSIVTPIKRKFDIQLLPDVFRQAEAKNQVTLVYNTLQQQDKWEIDDLKEKLPLSDEKVELILKVFSEKGFVHKNDTIFKTK
eukprot:NODE_36_length_36011_cov_1.012920.p17 type:complete len:207 gc:universal NODE_36_length_36011_cov_1.012920:25692-25072(-)